GIQRGGRDRRDGDVIVASSNRDLSRNRSGGDHGEESEEIEVEDQEGEKGEKSRPGAQKEEARRCQEGREEASQKEGRSQAGAEPGSAPGPVVPPALVLAVRRYVRRRHGGRRQPVEAIAFGRAFIRGAGRVGERSEPGWGRLPRLTQQDPHPASLRS